MEKKPFWRPSSELISRLKRSYRASIERELPDQNSVIWSMIGGNQQNIHDALMSDDKHAETLLSDPAKTNLYYGVDNLAKDVIDVIPTDPHQHDILISDMIEVLAEAMGVRYIFNSFGGDRFPDKARPESLTVDQYLADLAQLMRVDLKFPNPFPGEIGLDTGRGLISYRSIPAIYQAYRMYQLSQSLGGNKCLEIGAGMGRTIYYAQLLGLRCTVMDLPMTIVGQALYLSAVLGEDAIWLVGDPEPTESQVRLIPSYMIGILDEDFDVALNVDSFTEMGRGSAQSYIKYIETHMRALISVNHEANLFTVNEVARQYSKLRPISRSRYWLREGYTEEIFIVTGRN